MSIILVCALSGSLRWHPHPHDEGLGDQHPGHTDYADDQEIVLQSLLGLLIPEGLTLGGAHLEGQSYHLTNNRRSL